MVEISQKLILAQRDLIVQLSIHYRMHAGPLELILNICNFHSWKKSKN